MQPINSDLTLAIKTHPESISFACFSFFFFIFLYFISEMATPTLAHFKLPQIDNEPMVSGWRL
jgi:hypothetical protein